MKSTVLLWILCLLGCATMKKTDKSINTVSTEASKQTYLDKVAITNTGKETQTFTWWKDSAVYQYQLVKERAADTKTERLAVHENTSEAVKESKKRVDAVSVIGIIALLCLMTILFFFIQTFFLLNVRKWKATGPGRGKQVTVCFLS